VTAVCASTNGRRAKDCGRDCGSSSICEHSERGACAKTAVAADSASTNGRGANAKIAVAVAFASTIDRRASAKIVARSRIW